MKKNIRWILVGGLLISLVCLIVLIQTGKILKFDSIIYNVVTFNTNIVIDNINHIFTFFGSTVWMIILCALLLVIVKDKKKAVVIGICLVLAIVLNLGMKTVFARERPTVRRLVEETSYSFPSGHTTAAVSVYGSMLIYVIKSRYSKNKKIILSVGLAMLMFLVGVSRIYLGAHFASDVLGAALVTSAFVIVYMTVVRRKLS